MGRLGSLDLNFRLNDRQFARTIRLMSRFFAIGINRSGIFAFVSAWVAPIGEMVSSLLEVTGVSAMGGGRRWIIPRGKGARRRDLGLAHRAACVAKSDG